MQWHTSLLPCTTAIAVPIDQAAELITFNWAGGGNTYAANGFVTGYSAGAATAERMESTLTIKGSGAVTGLVA